MRRRVVPFVLVLLAAACGGDDGEDAAPTTGEPSTTTTARAPEETTTTAAATTEGVEVELLDAGTEPRAELRYELEEGATASYRQELEIEQALAGTTLSFAVSLPLDTTVVAVDDGLATVEAVYGEPQVDTGPDTPPELADQLTGQLAGFAGATITFEIDDRGGVQVADAEFGPSAAGQFVDQLTRSFAQLSQPFPVEPVGPGARWRTVNEVELGGVVTTATTEVTLVETGDEIVAEFTTSLEQSGAATGSGGGSGTYRIDPSHPIPTAESTAESSATVQGQTLTQRLTQRMVRV